MNIILNIIIILFLFAIIMVFSSKLSSYKSSAKNNMNFKPGEIKRISERSFFRRLLGIKTDNYFYDLAYIYQIKGSEVYKVPLSDIVKISPTEVKINNRRVWAVRYSRYGGAKEFRFRHNITFFNNDFLGFLAAVKAANPDVEIIEPTILRL